jgi:hypothetical protein
MQSRDLKIVWGAILFWLRGRLVDGIVGLLKHVDSDYWTIAPLEVNE